MEALRDKGSDFIIVAMKHPQVVSQSGYSMQDLVLGCKQVCPDHACSSTEKDGAFNQFTLTYWCIGQFQDNNQILVARYPETQL